MIKILMLNFSYKYTMNLELMYWHMKPLEYHNFMKLLENDIKINDFQMK